jgi:RNase H-fold protein (predicted Holliday junction resolvase)
LILGIDPGRDKCGLAVMSRDKKVIKQEVVETGELINVIKDILEEYLVETTVVGNGTLSEEIINELENNFKAINITEVDETNSTLEARDLYWQKQPPQGWRRLIPISFQTPPQPVDDYVAIILINRFLTKNKE